MAATQAAVQRREVADRVLRRAQVSKMTRALQDRLALASIKIQHGWQHRSIDSLEPEIERHLKRKRSNSQGDAFSDTASSASGRCFSTGVPCSSPLTAPMFSDELGNPTPLKRQKSSSTLRASSQQHSQARLDRIPSMSWKSSYRLPESSPIVHHRNAHSANYHGHNVSFVSQTSTIMDSPSASEDDDDDLPIHSFQIHSNNDSVTSPPRTPSPEVSRSARLRTSQYFSSPADKQYYPHGGREGADLLLYLASSPSPAMPAPKTPAMLPPSTPPAKTPLPSSMMSTPGGQMFLGFGAPNTPSTMFNFADFVNVTPSPAQGPWSKTPAAAKTPVVARDARRRLNHEGTSTLSPNITRSSARWGAGLGMDLGGELM